MHVTSQEGDANSSAQGILLESLDEQIALSLKSVYELKPVVHAKIEYHFLFRRPVVILCDEISSERN